MKIVGNSVLQEQVRTLSGRLVYTVTVEMSEEEWNELRMGDRVKIVVDNPAKKD